MSMTGSMCVSMTGRPTHLQIANEQRRQSYGYYQNAKATNKREENQYAIRKQPYNSGN